MEGALGTSSMRSLQYFKHALNLKNKVNLLNILTQSDIHPSPPQIHPPHYNTNKIKWDIEKQIKAAPHLWQR